MYFPSDDTYHANNKAFVEYLRDYITDSTANLDDDQLRKWIHTDWKLGEPNPQAFEAMELYKPIADGETILM